MLTGSKGLLATIVEDPLSIQASQETITSQMQSICKSQNIPLFGNAARNSQNYTNLTGQNTVAPYPKGALYP